MKLRLLRWTWSKVMKRILPGEKLGELLTTTKCLRAKIHILLHNFVRLHYINMKLKTLVSEVVQRLGANFGANWPLVDAVNPEISRGQSVMIGQSGHDLLQQTHSAFGTSSALPITVNTAAQTLACVLTPPRANRPFVGSMGRGGRVARGGLAPVHNCLQF